MEFSNIYHKSIYSFLTLLNAQKLLFDHILLLCVMSSIHASLFIQTEYFYHEDLKLSSIVECLRVGKIGNNYQIHENNYWPKCFLNLFVFIKDLKLYYPVGLETILSLFFYKIPMRNLELKVYKLILVWLNYLCSSK